LKRMTKMAPQPLSMVSPAWFRELDLDRLLLEQDVVRYVRLAAVVKTLKNWRARRGLAGDVGGQVVNALMGREKAIAGGIVKRLDPIQLTEGCIGGLGRGSGFGMAWLRRSC